MPLISYHHIMERNHTSRLFFGKYPYKIEISVKGGKYDPPNHTIWTVMGAKKFLKSQSIANRMYSSFTSVNKIRTTETSVFLSNKADFDRCVNLWQTYIKSVTEPYKEEHVNFLAENTEIILRPTLIYRRYRYIVLFKRAFKEDLSDITTWVNDTFTTYPSKSATAKYLLSGWNPRLYLVDESDLMLTKLTYGERIRSITMICIFDE